MYWITVLAEICFRAKLIMASPIVVREPGFDLVSHSRSGPLFALRLRGCADRRVANVSNNGGAAV
jgi:hypothetical protein